MSPSAKWTFMVYMAGDNNLSSAGDVDLTEMRRVGSTADVNLLVEFDNAGNRGTHVISSSGAAPTSASRPSPKPTPAIRSPC